MSILAILGVVLTVLFLAALFGVGVYYAGAAISGQTKTFVRCREVSIYYGRGNGWCWYGPDMIGQAGFASEQEAIEAGRAATRRYLETGELPEQLFLSHRGVQLILRVEDGKNHYYDARTGAEVR